MCDAGPFPTWPGNGVDPGAREMRAVKFEGHWTCAEVAGDEPNVLGLGAYVSGDGGWRATVVGGCTYAALVERTLRGGR